MLPLPSAQHGNNDNIDYGDDECGNDKCYYSDSSLDTSPVSLRPFEIQPLDLCAMKWSSDPSDAGARHAIPFKESREILS